MKLTNAVCMKTVAKMFNNKILFWKIRPSELKKEMSDRNLVRERDSWLLLVAVSTIVSAACLTAASIIRRGNRPMKVAMMNKIGPMTVHPSHHPSDTSCVNNDKRVPKKNPNQRPANAPPINAGRLCSIALSSKYVMPSV